MEAMAMRTLVAGGHRLDPKLWLATTIAVMVPWLGAAAPGLSAELVEFPLQQDLSQQPGLRLDGPNASQVARPDGQGLRIRLSADRSDRAGVGVATKFRLAGDFEATLTFEILAIEEQAPPEGAGVAMLLTFEKPVTGGAAISRLRKAKQEVFGASRITPGADGKDRYKTQNVPATGMQGKLRLVRTGPTLKYLIAEGSDEFREINSAEVGTEDVTDLRAQVRTAGKAASVDARLIHWAIQADALPNRPTLKPVVSSGWGWLVGTMFVLLVLGLGGGAGFYFWKQRA